MNNSPTPLMNNPTDVLDWQAVLTRIILPASLVFMPSISAAQSENTSQSTWYKSASRNDNDTLFFENKTQEVASYNAAQSQVIDAQGTRNITRSLVNATRDDSAIPGPTPFGALRLQFDTDRKFNNHNGQADLNVPMYDDRSSIVFTQLGYRHSDGRNTGNLGVGLRQEGGEWILGLNAFFDNNYSGDNRRLGVGVEAWRDYLKLSANSYFSPSYMHSSSEAANSPAHPANGYDIRAEGWLPAFPMLGVNFSAQRYQGDNLVIFGTGSPQSNPWVLTSGLSLTPIPLVTLGAQYLAGKAGQSDSQISLQINYRLGQTWRQQIDPQQVDASRHLSLSRYDLVERNNVMVSE